jgi:hypothetical protein
MNGRDRIVGAGLAEVSELKAIEMDVRKAVDNDVKRVSLAFSTGWPGQGLKSLKGQSHEIFDPLFFTLNCTGTQT